MKKYLLFIAMLPMIGIAQVKSKTAVKNKPKTAVSTAKTVVKETAAPDPAKPANGYLIIGDITGYADGTTVALLNGNTGAQESSSQVQKNKFTLTGSLPYPDFKLIQINNKPPYLNVFLDNSLVKVKGRSDSLEYSQVTGSPSHSEFIELNNIVYPYQQLFQEGNTDTLARKAASSLITAFIKKYPGSYVSPLAVYRHFQLNVDIDAMEQLFGGLTEQVKTGPIGNYVAQQIVIAKTSPIMGKPLPDFMLADSTGKMVSLSSFRGKYVLVDFWASWCRPCRMENPNVLASYNKYKDKNYTVLGVSIDKAKDSWIDAIKVDKLPWTHVLDSQDPNISIGQKFRINTIPQNLLVDPKGILIAKNLRGPALESKLASLFGN
ncbi:MAG: TlpA disulfide reductase family protein [Ferruginibacter sp.]